MSKSISSTRPFCLSIPCSVLQHASYKYKVYNNLFEDKMWLKLHKMPYSCIPHLTHAMLHYCHANCASFIMAWLFACRILIPMLVHSIYVGSCLFGSSSNRRWAGDISRNPGALPRSVPRFNWAARQALPHACIHIVPIASILFLHHWVAIALNWIPSIA